jgi:hypothetical protein
MILGHREEKGRKDAEKGGNGEETGMKPGASLWARMKEKTAKALAVLTVTGVVAAGCTFEVPGLDPVPIPEEDASTLDGGHDAGPDIDAGKDGGEDLDAGEDAGHDAGLDAGEDGGLDAGLDAGEDSGVDAGEDAGLDAGLDAGEDAGQDAGVDAGEDAGTPDAGPVACPGATTGSYSGYVNKTVNKLIGNYDFMYMGETSAGSGIGVLDIACHTGGASIIAGLQCPNSTTTTYDVTVDGKRITVTPYSVGSTSMGATINIMNHP